MTTPTDHTIPPTHPRIRADTHTDMRTAATGRITRTIRRRRWITWLAVVLTALLAAGCSADSGVDKVTVSAGSASITVPAALSCSQTSNDKGMLCDDPQTDAKAPHLHLAPGTPLTIRVPKAVGDTPWVVVFSYTDKGGTERGDRTPVFAPKKKFDYTLTPPKGAQLTRLEVQSLYATPTPSGGVEFPAVKTWVLLIDPISDAQ